MLKRKNLQSELGKELWDKYFGFLDKKPEPALPASLNKDYLPQSDKKQEIVTIKLEQELSDVPTRVEEQSSIKKGSDDLSEKIRAQFSAEQNNYFAQRPSSYPSVPVNLTDVVKYFKNNQVVGEEKLLVAATLALVNGSSFGIEGYSGSGKTFLADTLLRLVKDEVYSVGLSSKLAIFNDTERINGKKIIYIPELQKAMKGHNSPIIEAIKDLTEGRDAKRIVTKSNGQGTTEYTIRKGISIVYTLALENNFNPDEESSRRFIRLQTDSSYEHIDQIHQAKVRNRSTIVREPEKEQLEARLNRHLNACRDLDVNVLDPFAGYINSLMPKTQKSIGYVDHYYSLLDACAKFHHQDRVHFKVNRQNYLLINLEDHFTVFSVYFPDFLASLKDQSKAGEKQFFGESILPDWQECYQDGLAVLQNDLHLAEIVPNYGLLLSQWENRQVAEKVIYGTDYLSGERVPLANLNDEVKVNGLFH